MNKQEFWQQAAQYTLSAESIDRSGGYVEVCLRAPARLLRRYPYYTTFAIVFAPCEGNEIMAQATYTVTAEDVRDMIIPHRTASVFKS